MLTPGSLDGPPQVGAKPPRLDASEPLAVLRPIPKLLQLLIRLGELRCVAQESVDLPENICVIDVDRGRPFPAGVCFCQVPGGELRTES